MHVNLGYDFGFSTQLGYSYLTAGKRPLLLSLDCAIPMGETLFDDYKLRLGGQFNAIEKQNFILTAKLLGNFNRHETELVRIQSLGIETSVLAGYYASKWHVAAELGLLKPYTSHLKHADVMRENFPSITDGWYTSTGSYLIYGLQFGKAMTQGLDLSLRLGIPKALNGHKDALIARYAQIGLLKKF